MSKGNFVVIDMESVTGTALGACEVGMVMYSNGHPVDTFHSYIKPYDMSIHNPIAERKCSHITSAILESAPNFGDIHEDMMDFIGDNLLVCYNKSADMNYLYKNEKEAGKSGLCARRYLDMYKLFKSRFEDAYNNWFGSTYQETHKALEDAMHEAELFNEYTKVKDFADIVESNYVPENERPKADMRKFATVPYDPSILEDELLASYDMRGKIFVISGKSDYRIELEKSLEDDFGAIKRGSISKNTQFVLLGEGVGQAKREKLIALKNDHPDKIRIFSQEAVAKLIGL